MFHTENNIETPAGNFQSLLKLFSIFKINIWYDETIVEENVTDTVGIMCINSGKIIGCLLDNQPMEDFINPFVTNVMFQHFSLSLIIQSNQ